MIIRERSYRFTSRQGRCFRLDRLEMPAPPSSDLHRAFIQALLSRRTLPEKTAQKLYRRACQAVQGEHQWRV